MISVFVLVSIFFELLLLELQALKYPQNAFPHLLQLIAKKDGDPAVSHYKGFFPFSTLTVAGGDEGVRFSAE